MTFSQQLSFRGYGLAEGLSNPYIYALSEDINKIIWIGTGEGLQRFDGKKFFTYDTKYGFSTNFITSIFTDSKNRKWIGAYNGQISIYDDIRFFHRFPDSIISSRINKIRSTSQGKVLVATQSNGLFLIDEKFNIGKLGNFNQSEIILDAIETSNGNILVATDQGLFFLEKIQDEYKPKVTIKQLEYLNVGSILRIEKKEEAYLVGTEYDGIFKLTFEHGFFKVEKLFEEKSLPGDKLLMLALDKNNDLWISRQLTGLNKAKIEGNNIVSHTTYYKGKFKNYFFKTILFDEEQNVWLGSYGEGLFHLTKNTFSLLKPDNLLINQSFFLRGLTEKNDSLLITTDLDIYLYQEREDIFKKINLKYSKDFKDLKFTCIYFDRYSNRIFIGTVDRGVYEFDIKTGVISSWYYNKSDILSNAINYITSDHKGNIWVATENGVVLFDNKLKEFLQFHMKDGLAHNKIYSIFIDSKERVWFATHSSGVSYFENDVIKFIPTPFNSKAIDINCFAETQHNVIWVGTNGEGLIAINNKGPKIHFTRQNGLMSNFCYTLIRDENNKLWVGHKNGLSNIDLSSLQVAGISNTEVLEGLEINANSVTTGQRGLIWYGTNKGLLKYNPKGEIINKYENKNIVTGIRIYFNNLDTTKYKNLETSLSPPSGLKLNYKENHVTIDYIGICHTEPSKVLYKHFLEGHEETWSPPHDENFVTYSNLPPGKYRFHLISMNNDGVWNTDDTIYEFQIIPPFYQTWWFYFVVITIVIFIIIAIFDIRARRLQKQNQILENEKKKLESEIIQRKLTEDKLRKSEEQLKIVNEELNTFIWRSNHDLMGPLKTIQGLVYIGLNEKEIKVIHDYFEKIGQTSTKLDLLLRQFSKVTEVRKSKMLVTKVKIEDIIERAIRAVISRYAINKASITRDIRITYPVYSDSNFLFTMFYHLLDNAFQYQNKEVPIVKITVKQYRSVIRVVIEDEGVGVLPDAYPNIFNMFYKGNEMSKGYGLGLYIVKKVIQVMEGSIHLYSELGKGTSVVVRINSLPLSMAIEESEENDLISEGA